MTIKKDKIKFRCKSLNSKYKIYGKLRKKITLKMFYNFIVKTAEFGNGKFFLCTIFVFVKDEN